MYVFMTLNINVMISDGIIMASDSLLTHVQTIEVDNVKRQSTSPKSKTIQKTFLLEKYGIGISLRGNLTVNGLLITKYMNEFIASLGDDINILNIANKLLEYFEEECDQKLDTSFYIGGYLQQDNKYYRMMYLLNLSNKDIRVLFDDRKPEQRNKCTTFFGGDIRTSDILSNSFKASEERVYKYYGFDYHTFSISDAEDFCLFMIDTTSGMQRFSNEPLGVGGNISIAIITPYSCNYKIVERK